MAASNTKSAVRECVGRRIVGVLFDALPRSRSDLAAGNKTFVFDDGTGFTFASNGSFWQEDADQIRLAIKEVRDELEARKRDVQDVLDVAGALE